MPPTPSKRIASRGRMIPPYLFFRSGAEELNQDRCTINPDHCDTEFPTEPLNANGEKSYYILRFELSQLSSKYVTSILGT